MKSLITAFSFLFVFLTAHSQSIRFLPLSFADALAKAKKENKPLFIEIYTTWCTYCKQMERDVFTNKAADYYNMHFICMRYDATTTGGIQIRKSYTLPGLPAFLYLSPDGFVLRKTAGFQPAALFLSNADSALSIQNKNNHLTTFSPTP